MQRAFSGFPHGLPAAGLLILRLVAGSELILNGLGCLGRPEDPSRLACLVMGSTGIFLLGGFLTPIAGGVMAVLELSLLLRSGEPASALLFAAIGILFVSVGPGAWSIDARLFGLRRIEIESRRS